MCFSISPAVAAPAAAPLSAGFIVGFIVGFSVSFPGNNRPFSSLCLCLCLLLSMPSLANCPFSQPLGEQLLPQRLENLLLRYRQGQ